MHYAFILGLLLLFTSRYSQNLSSAKTVGILKGLAMGASTGFMYLCTYGMYGLVFWYGTTLVINEEIEVGDMMTTFFCILIAAMGLGMVNRNI